LKNILLQLQNDLSFRYNVHVTLAPDVRLAHGLLVRSCCSPEQQWTVGVVLDFGTVRLHGKLDLILEIRNDCVCGVVGRLLIRDERNWIFVTNPQIVVQVSLANRGRLGSLKIFIHEYQNRYFKPQTSKT
jgi:hypothetical protein